MKKGGSGKTTIALNIAVKLGLLKEDTFLLMQIQRSIKYLLILELMKILILFLILFQNLEAVLVKKLKSLQNKYSSL